LATEPPGSVLFNKHIHINDKLENPIKTLSELEFKFLTPSGHPYEFEGVDHSFTLEFYESIINNIFLTKEEKWNPKEEVVIKNT
jgi:hypothetical protein